jgi:hypothetical protein
MSNKIYLLLPLVALLGSGVTCITDVDSQYELKRGILEGIDLPADVSVPDTVQVHTPVYVVVNTYGGGCVFAKAHVNVSIDGLQAVVAPYDSVNVRSQVCRADLKLFTHIAMVVFGQRGTGTVRVLGRFGETDSTVRVNRTIVVN